ncbi:MAG TPA: adenine phosphoribosyltransferase [Myxococcota bacterium]|nr:adenine phosphoribosyltransferase [Myxococcota bacterium]
MTTPSDVAKLAAHIRDVPDFPRAGILFKDISPLLQDPESLRVACRAMAAPFASRQIDLVVAIESRGFIFGAPVAIALGAGFALARKQGKLPWQTRRESYELEYGSAEIEMHSDAVQPGQRVLLIDDVIATGGTAAATARLVRALGGEVVAAGFLIELGFLEGRKALEGLPVEAVLRF